MQTKRKKALKISAALVVLLFLLACEGTVCDRFINNDGELTVSYRADADPGDEGKPKITDVKVKEAEFYTCQMDERWPDCKEDAKDFPDLPDLPMNPKYRSYNVIDNQKSRIVCVDSVSQPAASITNRWVIGSHKGTDGPEEQGIYQTCFTASAGQTASIVSVHSDRRRSTILCTVWMFGRDGKKKMLDFAFSQRLAPCKAEARIP